MSNLTKTEAGREMTLGMQALKRIGKPEDVADVVRPELKAAWERGEQDRFYPYGKTYGQVFREQE
jgi:hypothetical protein